MTSIGEKVKKLRIEKKKTLKEMSEQTGLSVSFLSQFERGLSTIAIDALVTIAQILDTDVYELLNDTSAGVKSSTSPVLYSYQHANIQIHDDHLYSLNLSADPKSHSMLTREVTLLPNASDVPLITYRHSGEEFIYVLEGILTLSVNNEIYQLYPGDTAHFSSENIHYWLNQTNKITKVLIVNTPNPLLEPQEKITVE